VARLDGGKAELGKRMFDYVLAGATLYVFVSLCAAFLFRQQAEKLERIRSERPRQ
jgi:hypothetical protein